jgi:hypothetical protein
MTPPTALVELRSFQSILERLPIFWADGRLELKLSWLAKRVGGEEGLGGFLFGRVKSVSLTTRTGALQLEEMGYLGEK